MKNKTKRLIAGNLVYGFSFVVFLLFFEALRETLGATVSRVVLLALVIGFVVKTGRNIQRRRQDRKVAEGVVKLKSQKEIYRFSRRAARESKLR